MTGCVPYVQENDCLWLVVYLMCRRMTVYDWLCALCAGEWLFMTGCVPYVQENDCLWLVVCLMCRRMTVYDWLCALCSGEWLFMTGCVPYVQETVYDWLCALCSGEWLFMTGCVPYVQETDCLWLVVCLMFRRLFMTGCVPYMQENDCLWLVVCLMCRRMTVYDWLCALCSGDCYDWLCALCAGEWLFMTGCVPYVLENDCLWLVVCLMCRMTYSSVSACSTALSWPTSPPTSLLKSPMRRLFMLWVNYLFTESDTVATLFFLSREQSQNLPFVTFLRNQLLRFGLTVLPFFFCHHDESFFSLCDIIFAVELFLCLCDIAFAMELFLSLCGVVQHAWMVSECWCFVCAAKPETCQPVSNSNQSGEVYWEGEAVASV